jgi:hypothetical protein
MQKARLIAPPSESILFALQFLHAPFALRQGDQVSFYQRKKDRPLIGKNEIRVVLCAYFWNRLANIHKLSMFQQSAPPLIKRIHSRLSDITKSLFTLSNLLFGLSQPYADRQCLVNGAHGLRVQRPDILLQPRLINRAYLLQ